jgi:hypothetical protein
MRYVYPVLMNGRILTVTGNDRRALAAMRRAAAGFGAYDSRKEARFPMPADEAKRGAGERVAEVTITPNGHTHHFHAERWLVTQDQYTGDGRKPRKL